MYNNTRLQWYYEQMVRSDLVLQYSLTNVYQVPRFDRITLHSSQGKGAESGVNQKKHLTSSNHKLVAHCAALSLCTGQSVHITRCKIPRASFQTRKGDPLGAQVILRRSAMFYFLDELITLIWPRNNRPEFQNVRILSNDNKHCRTVNYCVDIGFHNAFLWPVLEAHYDVFPESLGFQITIQINACQKVHANALCNAIQIPS